MENRFEVFTTQISKISRYIRKIKSIEMSKFNLKTTHVSCLYYLYKSKDNMTAKELCDICDEDKSAISRSIDYLEKNEYIMCTSKTEKRYKSPLFLTEKGKAVGIEIAKKIDNFLNEASEGISEENRDNLYKSLAVISNNLQKICEKLGEKYD